MTNVVRFPGLSKSPQELVDELVGDPTLTGIVLVSLHGEEYRIKCAGVKWSEISFCASMIEYEVQNFLKDD